MTHRRAHLLAWILALLPALIALAMLRSSDLAGPGAILNYFGRLTGIMGLALMLAAAVLSCRVPGFDRPFGGLTKLWKTHHLLAAAAFLMLLVHPLLLALAAADASLAAAVATLRPPPGDWAVRTGWAALVGAMIFLAPSFKFFGEPDYQRWKFLHRLAAPVVILGIAHTLYFARTLPWPLDPVVWLGLATLAVVSIAYRLVYARLWGRHGYRVESVAHPANNVVELTLAPTGAPLAHDAGQFVYLTPYDRTLAAGHAEEHPYTLSSAPGEPGLRIAIKALGDASRAIQDIAPGSPVEVEGPYGSFFPGPDAPAEPELWVAGGIGITPFLARARALAEVSDGLDVVLVYCVQDEARALFADELRALFAQLPSARLEMHYFYRNGPLEASFLTECCPDAGSRRLYACGPDPLLERVKHIAPTIDIGRSRVVTEEFNLL